MEDCLSFDDANNSNRQVEGFFDIEDGTGGILPTDFLEYTCTTSIRRCQMDGLGHFKQVIS